MTASKWIGVFFAGCAIIFLITLITLTRRYFISRPGLRNLIIVVFFVILNSLLATQIILLHGNKFWINSIIIGECCVALLIIFSILIIDLPHKKDK